MENSILTQIGFVVLVGFACKNAILIVQFAKAEEKDGGKGRHEAVARACRPAAFAANLNDFLCLYFWRHPSCDRPGGRIRNAAGGGNGCFQRNDRCVLLRAVSDAGILRGAEKAFETPSHYGRPRGG